MNDERKLGSSRRDRGDKRTLRDVAREAFESRVAAGDGPMDRDQGGSMSDVRRQGWRVASRAKVETERGFKEAEKSGFG